MEDFYQRALPAATSLYPEITCQFSAVPSSVPHARAGGFY